MAWKDFRTFMNSIDQQGQLLRVHDEIDTLDEMGAFIARADYAGIEKSILFENPKGYDIPVLANTVGISTKRIADSFGVDRDHAVANAARKMSDIMAKGGVKPVSVDKDKAPCKEIIWKGDDIDLSKLPILRYNPMDGSGAIDFWEGRFIGSLACSKPDEGSHNLSYHRFELTKPDAGTVWIFRGTGDAKSIEEHWGSRIDDPSDSWDMKKAKPFPMAYVLGVPPEYIMTGANTALPYKYDDFSFVGGLMEQPVEMVKCETIDVDVPADAEIVVEGIMEPFEWAMQGRFGSFNGFYDESHRRPVFRITAVTMRKNPTYQHVHIGRPMNETNNIAAFFRALKIFNDLQQVLPNVTDVHVAPEAGCGFTVHVAMKKNRIGEPRMAMMRAYTTLQGFCKHVFVYDDDIDIRNPIDRDWALAHRFMADRDLVVVPNVLGHIIDPLAQGKVGTNSKLGVYDGTPEIPVSVRPFMGVDCTVPLGLEVMNRVVPEPEIESRIDDIWKAAVGDIG